jgi:mutual gliding-motility protein MglA
MASINFKKKEIECKIVYYGPGRSGKTTNLEHIFQSYKKYVAGEMISIKTEGDRTLFFDFLPIGIGMIKGFNVRVQLYTVPGQVQYKSTRKLVLKQADGIVFVADSVKVRREKNILSLKDMQSNLKEYGISVYKIPLVLQYNKRDLVEQGIPLIPLDLMEKELNGQLRVPSFPAVATTGQGVGQTLKECLKLTIVSIRKQLKLA